MIENPLTLAKIPFAQANLQCPLIFAEVMKDLSLCQVILEALLEMELEEISPLPEGKRQYLGSCFVIRPKGEGKEQQVLFYVSSDKEYLGKQMRFFLSHLVCYWEEESILTPELTHIPFVCTFDWGDKDLPRYDFSLRIVEAPETSLPQSLDPFARTAFNACSQGNAPLVQDFYDYLMRNSQESELGKRLHRAVTACKEAEGFQEAYETWQQEEQELWADRATEC